MAKPVSKQPEQVYYGTLIESDEDIRRAELADRVAVPVAAPAAPAPKAKPRPAEPFTPTNRPSVCVLTIFDDGTTDGEKIRIRDQRFTIGRTEGDFRIPHDEQISTKHIEITRQIVNGQDRWVVTDLQSTNDLFLRVSRTIHKDRAEFLVGKGKYRFEFGTPTADTIDHVKLDSLPQGTVRSDAVAPKGTSPTLVELVAGGVGSRIALTKSEYWIGSDPGCAMCRAQDPFAEPRHVRVFRDSEEGWYAQNNKTANGLWLKVAQVTVEDSVLCQIGEQRFRLKVGG